jgi:hypothetical protein
MLSLTDELCMTVYINTCRFHFILLVIRIHDGDIHVLDSLRKDPEEYKTCFDMLAK